jgi:hypothetical protein
MTSPPSSTAALLPSASTAATAAAAAAALAVCLKQQLSQIWQRQLQQRQALAAATLE